jgi:methylphosphotriester-DNA--protein-cysteine methyltransferase
VRRVARRHAGVVEVLVAQQRAVVARNAVALADQQAQAALRRCAQQLCGGDLPVARIAARCGFACAEAMRLAFQRHLNVTPTDFRARFQSAGAGESRG